MDCVGICLIYVLSDPAPYSKKENTPRVLRSWDDDDARVAACFTQQVVAERLCATLRFDQSRHVQINDDGLTTWERLYIRFDEKQIVRIQIDDLIFVYSAYTAV